MKVLDLKDGRTLRVVQSYTSWHAAVCQKCGTLVAERGTNQIAKFDCPTPSCDGGVLVDWGTMVVGFLPSGGAP